MFKVRNQVSYWNDVAAEKEFTHPVDFEEFQKAIDKDACILDYGCGYGRTLQQLFENGYRNIRGIDYSTKMIERGKQKYPHLEMIVNHDFSIPFKDNSFDVVFLFAVLTCNPGSEQQAEIINEIYRVLKPNGIIYVSDYPLQQDERNIDRYKKCQKQFGCYGIFSIENNIPMRHHAKDYIDDLLSRFKPFNYKEIEIMTMNNNKTVAFQYLGRK